MGRVVGAGLLAGALGLLGCSDRAIPTQHLEEANPSIAAGESLIETTSTSVLTYSSRLAVTKCITASTIAVQDGTPVVIAPCHGGATQQFTPTSSGELRLGGLCLDAYSGRGRDGDALVMWGCHGGSNQKWTHTSAGEIRGINSKCIDVYEAKAVDGAQLVIWSCHGSSNQLWTEHRQTPGAVALIEIQPNQATLSVGATLQLTAVAKDAAGVTIPNATFSWSSSKTSVATVSGSGLVTARAVGTASITATSGGKSASVPVSVADAGCSGIAHDRLVRVATVSELKSALSNARPGDLIQMADGTYLGQYRLRTSGTASKRITLCGSRRAILDGGSITSSLVVGLTANYWTLVGFTIRNGLWAVLAERASHNILRDLEISHTGQEGAAFRVYSSYNVFEKNWVHNTGRYRPKWGEGVYMGSWSGHWCERTNCLPDRSDYNQVLNNTFGPNVTVEAIDGKHGTTGGIIRGNTFNGVGMGGGSTHPTPPWIELQGNDYLVENNSGVRSTGDGMEIYSALEGWGQRNIVRNNNFDLQSSGYGFRLAGKTITSKIYCNNVVKNAGSGFATVKCTP